MKTILTSAAAAAAFSAILSTPTTAAPVKHTWFSVNYAEAKCERSEDTPEQIWDTLSGPLSHMQGYTVDRIGPDNVTKDDKGVIHVHITGTHNGNTYGMNFFTSKAACDAFIKEQGIEAEGADSSDLN